MHHNYAVEKWLIELHTSHAAAIYGWKVVLRGDGEETLLGILTHHSLVALPSPSPPPTHTHSYTRPMQQPFTGGRWCFEATARRLGGVRGDASEIPASAAAAGAGASAAAGDSAGGADGGGGGGAAAAGDSAGGGASAAGAGAAAAAAAAAAGGAAGDNSEWGESVFCLVPPSRAQWTVQLAKAILSGCIPVTFLPLQDAFDQPGLVERLQHNLGLVQVGTGVGGSAVNSPPAAASPPAALNYPVFLLNVDPADLHSLPHRLQVGIVAGGTGAGETGAGETGAGGTGAGVTGAGGTGAGGTSAGGTGAGGTSAGGTGAGGTGAGGTGALGHAHPTGHDMFKWHGSLDQGAGAVLIPLSVFPMSRGGAHEQAEEDWSSGAIAAHHSSLLISLLCTFLPQDMFKWHDSLDQGAGAVLMSRLRRIGAAAAAQITAA
ncbi:unnamed protein product [Closterium sp. NIES-64]|nr:unnamed protein product [Closterium sp. NIES-64]